MTHYALVGILSLSLLGVPDSRKTIFERKIEERLLGTDSKKELVLFLYYRM